MKIYPAYDPPEYREWQPDPKVMADYSARMGEPEIEKSLHALGEVGLENLYLKKFQADTNAVIIH